MDKNVLKEDLCFRAGFCGFDLSKTQFGTCHETAIENLIELVVQECCSAVRNTNLEDVDGGDSAVLGAAATQIKQHFGV